VDVHELPFPKEQLTPIEERTIKARLWTAFGDHSFLVKDSKIKVAFNRKLLPAEDAELRRIFETLYSNDHELNFDIDRPADLGPFLQKLTLKFPPNRIEVRHSARRGQYGGGYHVRITGQRFGADELIWLRQQFGEDEARLRMTKAMARDGLALDFLFDVKRGLRAGEWRKLEA
jgi:hypothetical protein